MKFCNICNSVFKKSYGIRSMTITCTKCNISENPTPSETLIYEEVYNQSSSGEGDYSAQLKSFLRNIEHDRCNLKIRKECPKCSAKIVTYVMEEQTCKHIYKCLCGYLWT